MFTIYSISELHENVATMDHLISLIVFYIDSGPRMHNLNQFYIKISDNSVAGLHWHSECFSTIIQLPWQPCTVIAVHRVSLRYTPCPLHLTPSRFFMAYCWHSTQTVSPGLSPLAQCVGEAAQLSRDEVTWKRAQ